MHVDTDYGLNEHALNKIFITQSIVALLIAHLNVLIWAGYKTGGALGGSAVPCAQTWWPNSKRTSVYSTLSHSILATVGHAL